MRNRSFSPSARSWSKLGSCTYLAVTYLVALLASWFSWRVLERVGISHALLLLLACNVVATTVVFWFSFLADNSSVYDPYWSLQPLGTVAFYFSRGTTWQGWQVAIGFVVLLYSLRLTANFLRDWPGLSKEDFRYAELRSKSGPAYWPLSFLGIHLFPTVMVYLGCWTLYSCFSSYHAPFKPVLLLGIGTTLLAIVVAFVADEQLRNFRRSRQVSNQIIQHGLWARSRHPNYLGEILTWWGLWLVALSNGLRWWWTGFGAVVITAMFIRVSIPWMERRLEATKPGYASYKESTPMLLPFRGSKPSVSESKNKSAT